MFGVLVMVWKLLLKDLNIVDSQCHFDYHIKPLGFIIRTSKDLNDINCFKMLYCSFVKSVVENACNCVVTSCIDLFKEIQRKFFRFVAYKMGILMENINYKDMENLLILNYFTQRRDQTDFFTLFKTLNDLLNSPDLLHIIFYTSQTYSSIWVSFIRFHRKNYDIDSLVTTVKKIISLICFFFLSHILFKDWNCII